MLLTFPTPAPNFALITRARKVHPHTRSPGKSPKPTFAPTIVITPAPTAPIVLRQWHTKTSVTACALPRSPSTTSVNTNHDGLLILEQQGPPCPTEKNEKHHHYVRPGDHVIGRCCRQLFLSLCNSLVSFLLQYNTAHATQMDKYSIPPHERCLHQLTLLQIQSKMVGSPALRT